MYKIPKDALIVPIGPSACGKSTTMEEVFGLGALVSSDECRRLICGDTTRQDVNAEAFSLFHQIIDSRLARGVLTVADATNLTSRDRQKLYKLAHKYDRPVVNIMMGVESLETLRANNQTRDRQVPEYVLERHWNQFQDIAVTPKVLQGTILQATFPYPTLYDLELEPTMDIVEADSWWVIGDVHGCYDELRAMLSIIPKEDKIVFVGDFVDRGPNPRGVLRLVQQLIASGRALATLGNHDWKMVRGVVLGRNIKVSETAKVTMAQVSKEDLTFLLDLPLQVHITTPTTDRKVTVVHGALKYEDRGIHNKATEAMCLYGETDGTKTDAGYPNRTYVWVDSWEEAPGDDMCVFGHTPVDKPTRHGTSCINIDTGCAFGGALTAYNPFEDKFITVPAFDVYAER